MVVDYARFDAMADALSDDDDAVSAGRPFVTRLNAPSRVTFGGREAEVRVEREGESGHESGDGAAEAAPTREGSARANGDAPPTSARAFVAPTLDAQTLAADGACVPPTHYWSQTRDEVVLSVAVPPATRAKDVALHVSRGEPGTAQCIGVGVRTAGAGTVTWHKRAKLARRIVLDDSEDAAPADDLDWSLADVRDGGPAGFAAGHRVVRVWLRKEHPGGGLAVAWWASCFEDDDVHIDTSTIAARRPERATHAREVADAWRAAEAEFVQRASLPS